MLPYILKRVLLFFPTLFGVVLLSFTIIQFVPGGPLEQMVMKSLGTQSGGEVGGLHSGLESKIMKRGLDPEQIAALQKLYDFDKPWYHRLWRWTYKLFTFQFGESYFHHREVIELVKDKLPVSVSLGLISFFLSYVLCIPLGVWKAVRQGSFFDLSTSVLMFLGYSVPGFVLGVLLIVLFAGGSFWNFFPLNGLVSANFAELSAWEKVKDYLHHLALPIICMGIGSFAVMTNLARNSVLEHLRQQYVLTARAKGLNEKIVLWKHVFRNAMIPLVTAFAGNFLTVFLGSSLLIESLFSLDGLGLLSYESVLKRDYPVVMANLFVFSLFYVLGNLLSDIAYVLIDPRISFQAKE